jgi:glutamate transport system permease protein
MSSGSVLFDAPGPRARRRHALLTVVGSLLALAIVGGVVVGLARKDQFAWDKWEPFITAVAWQEWILPGLWGTLKAAAISVALALVFGLLFGMGRLSIHAPIRWLSSVVVEFFRAVPVLIMMIFAWGFYVQTQLFDFAIIPLAAVVTGLTLYNGSVLAELVRSGVHSLPRGQSEAGLSIGLTVGQTLRSIQLPQALTAMLPALVSQLVVVLKDSALGYIILYPETLRRLRDLGAAYANLIPAMMVAAVLFILMNLALTAIAGRVEKYLTTRGHTAGRPQAQAQAIEEG